MLVINSNNNNNNKWNISMEVKDLDYLCCNLVKNLKTVTIIVIE